MKYWVCKRGAGPRRRGARVPGRQRVRRGLRDAAAVPRRAAELDLGGIGQRRRAGRAAGDRQGARGPARVSGRVRARRRRQTAGSTSTSRARAGASSRCSPAARRHPEQRLYDSQFEARRLVEDLAVALQASLLVRHCAAGGGRRVLRRPARRARAAGSTGRCPPGSTRRRSSSARCPHECRRLRGERTAWRGSRSTGPSAATGSTARWWPSSSAASSAPISIPTCACCCWPATARGSAAAMTSSRARRARVDCRRPATRSRRPPAGSPLDPRVMMANHDPAGVWDPMVDYAMMSRNVRAFMSLFHCSKPVVCKVHGFCVAGGTDMALCSDLLVIAADAKIGYPPARVWGSPTTPCGPTGSGPSVPSDCCSPATSLSGAEALRVGAGDRGPGARGARRSVSRRWSRGSPACRSTSCR